MACGLAVKRLWKFGDHYDKEVGDDVKRPRRSHCYPFQAQQGTLASSSLNGLSLSKVETCVQSACNSDLYVCKSSDDFDKLDGDDEDKNKMFPIEGEGLSVHEFTDIKNAVNDLFSFKKCRLADDDHCLSKRKKYENCIGFFENSNGLFERRSHFIDQYTKEVAALVTSPFRFAAGKAKLNRAQIILFLRAEIRSLRRRKLIACRSVPNFNAKKKVFEKNEFEKYERGSKAPIYRISPNSPTESVSSVDSDGEGMGLEKKNNLQKFNACVSKYTLHEVKILSERLLSKQEVHLRHECDNLLAEKIQAKYDYYVEMAMEQISRENELHCTHLPYVT